MVRRHRCGVEIKKRIKRIIIKMSLIIDVPVKMCRGAGGVKVKGGGVL